jgi:hypothetical protein
MTLYSNISRDNLYYGTDARIVLWEDRKKEILLRKIIKRERKRYQLTDDV